MDATYITSAQKADQLPEYELPEFAFMGRSNAGKSSLLNALAERKGLARSSSTPGRTQMVNFFSISNRIILADLPGYGFNVARKEIRKLWDGLIAKYVQRPNISHFLFLIDCRRKLEEFEFEFIKNLSKQTSVILVLTKTDKVKKNQVRTAQMKFKKKLAEENIPVEKVFAISALKKTGIPELQQYLGIK